MSRMGIEFLSDDKNSPFYNVFKMKTIEIDDIWDVRKILDGSKVTVIRKVGELEDIEYNIGDNVTVEYASDNQYKYFCTGCGAGAFTEEELSIPPMQSCPHCGSDVDDVVSKHFADALITHVGIIELHEGRMWEVFPEIKIPVKSFDITLNAIRDGFDCREEFFKYFNDKYDISTPRKFYVYTFKLVK